MSCVAIVLFPAATACALDEETYSEADEELTTQSMEMNRYAKVVTAKGTLNMRSEARDKAKILTRLRKGAFVRIVDDQGEWTKIQYKGRFGYVKASFLEEIDQTLYSRITKEDKGNTVLALKRALHKLGYLKSGDVNTRFDKAMERALTKAQLLNGIELSPLAVTPELQVLLECGMLVKCKSGYLDTATDKDSGLMVSIFCWDSGGTLYEEDQSVKVKVSFATQANGGQPPYTVTVRKSLKGGGRGQYGDVVTSPFSYIWGKNSDCLYIYATVIDSTGNTATACAVFRYHLPARYTE